MALPALADNAEPIPRSGLRGREGLVEPRRIVNRRRLAAELEALEDEGTLDRARIVEVLKRTLAEGRAEVARRLDETKSGPACAAATAYLMDQVVRVLFDVAETTMFPVANPTEGERLALVAIGGYGRGELAPFSDIDLLFLLPYKRTPRAEQIVESILYVLWDLGLKVGHAVRSVEECIRQAKADMTIRTSLMEARYIWGEQKLHQDLKRRFNKEIVADTAQEFVEAKLAESQKRHMKLGDSRYVVEPNIKDGKGGLRDLHTLFWIAKYVYRVEGVEDLVLKGVVTEAEARTFTKAHHFLWTLRFHLHLVAGRPEERLTFDVQREIGRRMGYRDHAGTRGVERFMKHYYLVAKDVGDLTRILCAAIESQNQRPPRFRLPRFSLRRRDLGGFVLEAERLAVPSNDFFTADPVNLLRLFHVAQAHDLDIHPRTMQLATRQLDLIDGKLRANAEANRLFLETLAAPRDSERILRRMNEVGVFGRFVPDFGRVVAQMQFDMYHVYTVDEHTLFALGIMHRIEDGKLTQDHPLSAEVIHKVQSRRALYVALLLHDIAKGRGGDHSELGAEIARKFGPRVGLSPEETETVAWLVLSHLAMSNTAFKRDINDPKTIADFAKLVQSPERLRLLLVLTVADIRGVGPNIWNNWKAALLRELYWRTEEVLVGTSPEAGKAERVRAAQAALRDQLKGWTDAEFAQHVDKGYPDYWLGLDTETHARHARLVMRAEKEGAPLAVDTQVDPRRSVTEITLYTADHPGLFSRIAGAIAVSGANIVDARIYTLANGMALDTFGIQDSEGKAVERANQLAKLSVLIEQSLNGKLKTLEELARRAKSLNGRTRALALPPRVLIDNKASATHTLIEINGRDRPGLLFRVTRALTQLNLQISTAKISTYGERVVDVFYVKDVFGLKVEQEHRLADIRARLIEVLTEQPADPKRKPAPAKGQAA